MLTTAQIRAARHALRWSVAELASLSNVSTSIIEGLEDAEGLPEITKANLMAIRICFEQAGVEFVGALENGPGIRIWLAQEH